MVILPISAGQYVFSVWSQAGFPLHMRAALFLQRWYQGSTSFPVLCNHGLLHVCSFQTDEPVLKSLHAFCLAVIPVSRTLGLRRVSLVHSSLPIKSLAGVWPVVVCDVFLHVKRKFASLLFSEVWSIFEARKVCLRVCTSLRASPFVQGWYGAEVVCLIPLYCMNWRKHSETNWGPLSETSWSGKPFRENILLSTPLCCSWRHLYYFGQFWNYVRY